MATTIFGYPHIVVPDYLSEIYKFDADRPLWTLHGDKTTLDAYDKPVVTGGLSFEEMLDAMDNRIAASRSWPDTLDVNFVRVDVTSGHPLPTINLTVTDIFNSIEFDADVIITPRTKNVDGDDVFFLQVKLIVQDMSVVSKTMLKDLKEAGDRVTAYVRSWIEHKADKRYREWQKMATGSTKADRDDAIISGVKRKRADA